MRSERVLIKVVGSDDWRGDDLRFVITSADAVLRRQDLMRSYPRTIEDGRIVKTDDAPTHRYVDGHLLRLADVIGDEASPPAGYGSLVDDPDGDPLDYGKTICALLAVAVVATLIVYGL